jgi:exodeoxyribonuclease V beta subunit
MHRELSRVRGGDEQEPVAPAPSVDTGTESMAVFPGGSWAGTFIHALLEGFEFSREVTEQTRAMVRSRLETYGFGTKWEECLCTMLQQLARTSLDASGQVSLSRVGPRQRLHEMEFFHPLRTVSPSILSSLFTGGGLSAQRSAERLGRLEFSPQRGFMRGFVDLVFVLDGTYYLLDWKSNRLGPDPSHYGQAALQAAMEEGHYTLQYHLYTLAVNRYLGGRVPGYGYAESFGGVFYVFVRGIDPERAPGWSVFHDRPDPAFIEELDRRLIGA